MSPKFCVLCTSTGGKCPNNYQLPIHQELSDTEEQKDLCKQQKDEELEKQHEEEDWDNIRQK